MGSCFKEPGQNDQAMALMAEGILVLGNWELFSLPGGIWMQIPERRLGRQESSNFQLLCSHQTELCSSPLLRGVFDFDSRDLLNI